MADDVVPAGKYIIRCQKTFRYVGQLILALDCDHYVVLLAHKALFGPLVALLVGQFSRTYVHLAACPLSSAIRLGVAKK